ncbi:Glycosyl transferase family 2 [Lachnospiraceae bacterium XBB2008]|nr:Glycosyl transferase family 2 [Lachnospiraceae bacterium XBB2008]
MITAVSMIKNSADVIETMIRGNALVADNFVIIDNSSTDRTREILASLMSEGISIEIIDDDSVSPYQKDRVNHAIKYVLDKYNPLFILPLDDDEIICSEDNSINARDLKSHIESLDCNNLYYLNWRNYIPTEEDDLKQPSVAVREKFCLGDEPEMTKKVIVPRAIAAADDFELGWGGHFAACSKIHSHILLHDVRLAHYPIRSPEQMASKAIVGWLNYLSMPNRDKDLSVHWQIMYKAVKEYGLPSTDTMMTLANLYRENPSDTDNLNVIYNPISIPEDVFSLKYTHPSEINLLKNICENAEHLAVSHATLLEKTLSDDQAES